MDNHRKRPSRFSVRSGKIALQAMILVLLIAVLIAWVGNAGHTVHQKMEVQNATDVVGYSGSLWMARGMNTVTTCNHLVGEATAIGVVHDAIGGPELRLGLRRTTAENERQNSVIRTTAVLAPISRIPSVYVPPPLTNLDRRIIEFVTRRTSPTSDELQAFAALYDSRMTLKRELALLLSAKSIANLAFLIPPPFGYPPAILAVVTHVVASSQIVLIGKEWLLLEVLEKYARAAAPIQEKAFAGQLVPTLVGFAAEVAGLDLNSPETPAEGGLAIDEIEDSTADLATQHRVEAEVVPRADERRLPLIFEPPPNLGGRSGDWPPQWGSDQASALPDATNQLDQMRQSIDDAAGKLTGSINRRRRAIDDLQDIRDSIKEKVDGGELLPAVQSQYEDELVIVDEAIATHQKELDDLIRGETEIASQRQSIEQVLGSIVSGQSENLSLQHIPDQLDPGQERTSQWVRATAPNVDALRAPLLGLMQSQLRKSHAAEHYEKWTNRYSLIQSWKFRSGMRLKKTGSASAEWQQQKDPLLMAVLPDSFDNEQSVKGNEPWTRADEDGKAQAEDRFTLLTAAHRDYSPLFAPGVLRAGRSDAMTTLAQTILYNANPQRPQVGTMSEQPVVGWDTLNWDTEIRRVPEWGAEASIQATRWPWELLSGLQFAPPVKLNWQPKLVPITRGRLQLAADQLESQHQDAAQFALEHVELISH
jgi:hypothetical protein